MNKLITYSLIGVVALAAFVLMVPNGVSAQELPVPKEAAISCPHNRCDRWVEFVLRNMASVLDMDVDVLREELESGKTYLEIAEELGFTEEELEAMIRDQISIYLDALVEAGVITQERADQRLERIRRRQESWDGVAPSWRFLRRWHRCFGSEF